MRHRPAPSAERTASSCWRASARTSSRLATLVQAISITTPIVPITTQSTVWMLPTTVSFSGSSAGVIFHLRYQCGSLPGPFVHESIHTFSRRATSAFACGMETPGRSRAMPR